MKLALIVMVMDQRRKETEGRHIYQCICCSVMVYCDVMKDDENGDDDGDDISACDDVDVVCQSSGLV